MSVYMVYKGDKVIQVAEAQLLNRVKANTGDPKCLLNHCANFVLSQGVRLSNTSKVRPNIALFPVARKVKLSQT